MNINEDLLGKEVIDDLGNRMGVVKDVTWDYENNRVESIVIQESGFHLFGSSEKKFVSYENIHSIGDKVLVNITITAPAKVKKEEEDDEFGLNNIRSRL